MAETDLRPALTRHLQERVNAFREGFRHNLALVGQPGSGKTFQLKRLAENQPSDIVVVYCAVYRESCTSFLKRLTTSILQAGLNAPSGESLDALILRAEGITPNVAESVRHLKNLWLRRTDGEAFVRTLDLIPMLITDRGRRAMLILDEFLYLEELGLGHAFQEVGKRVMTWPSTLFILASSSPYRARIILREKLQLLFGQFELVNLEEISSDRIQLWLKKELEPLAGAPSLAPFLSEWLGTQPWYLSVLVNRIRELASLSRTRQLSESLFLQAAWDILGESGGPLQQWCASRIEPLSHMKNGKRAVEVLLQIADGARTATAIGQRIGRAGIHSILQLVLEQDLVHRNGVCWVSSDPILRCWLSTILWSERVGSGDPEQMRARLDRYLQVLWREWERRQNQSITEQVRGLLSQFCDETITLEHKTGRLPRFKQIDTLMEDKGRGAYLVADGRGRRWCCSVTDAVVTEQGINRFERFCRNQSPRPARKVVIAAKGLQDNAKLLAKATNMWVWGRPELDLLNRLYQHPWTEVHGQS